MLFLHQNVHCDISLELHVFDGDGSDDESHSMLYTEMVGVGGGEHHLYLRQLSIL